MFLRLFIVVSAFFISLSTHPIHSSQVESKIPVIVYLKGSCSAGKSTLIKSIQREWENWEIIDEDPIAYRTDCDAVALRFPVEYADIVRAIAQENLYHALRSKDILFKKMATLEECLKANSALCEIQDELDQQQNLAWSKGVRESIRKKIVEAIQLALKQGKIVLLDSWYFTADQIQKLFPETPVIRVMLYCPLPLAYERFLKRNEEAVMYEDLREKRYINQLMGSFYSLYQISNQPLQPIQRIDSHELDLVFRMISLTLKDKESSKQSRLFTFEQPSRSQFQELCSEFMRPFTEFASANFYISPKERQDLIIDTSTENIQKTLDFLKKVVEWENIEPS